MGVDSAGVKLAERKADVRLGQMAAGEPPMMRRLAEFLRLDKLGFELRTPEEKALDHAADLFYAECSLHLDYAAFLRQHDLPDTFLSWFTTTFLHIWSVTLRRPGRSYATSLPLTGSSSLG